MAERGPDRRFKENKHLPPYPEPERVNRSRTPEEIAELKRKIVSMLLAKIPRHQIAEEVDMDPELLHRFIMSHCLTSVHSPEEIRVRKWKRGGGTGNYKR